jgi:hypothetical protein
MIDRIGARLRAYDGLGVLRAATPDDLPAARWLAAQAGTAWLAAVAIPRFEVLAARAEWAGGAVEGMPLFDGGLTGPAGVAGRLGSMADAAAAIGFLELHPGAASLKQMPFERQRRESRHQAILVALRTLPDGLAPLNAPNFLHPFGPPVLQVAGREAAALAALAAAGAAIRVTLDARRGPGESANVLAEVAGGGAAWGSGGDAAPLVVMTPRTSWWTSLSERAGGILAWLEALAAARAAGAAAALARPLRFAATCGHELGHLGLAAMLDSAPGLVGQARLFIHLGANLGAAGDPRLTVRSNLPGLAARAAAALAEAGYAPGMIEQAPGETANGEAHDILVRGGRFLSFIGANPRFHAPEDRWPESVDVPNATAIAAAVAHLTVALAREP